jgi:hypothetical protein
MNNQEKDLSQNIQKIIPDAGRPAGMGVTDADLDTWNHKGNICRINPLILCQEGYCSECWISKNNGGNDETIDIHLIRNPKKIQPEAGNFDPCL